jgi:hypothetical protein
MFTGKAGGIAMLRYAVIFLVTSCGFTALAVAACLIGHALRSVSRRRCESDGSPVIREARERGWM